MTITNDDVALIVKLMDQQTAKIVNKIKNDLKHLPTKDEYYKREDETMKELKEIREEISVLSAHSSDHSDRLDKLEKIHPQSKHYAVA